MAKLTNKQVAGTKRFIKLCQQYGVKPTTRQASKLRLRKGTLWSRIKNTHKPLSIKGVSLSDEILKQREEQN